MSSTASGQPARHPRHPLWVVAEGPIGKLTTATAVTAAPAAGIETSAALDHETVNMIHDFRMGKTCSRGRPPLVMVQSCRILGHRCASVFHALSSS